MSRDEDILRRMHGYLSSIYDSESTLSGVIESMMQDLDEAEVQAIM